MSEEKGILSDEQIESTLRNCFQPFEMATFEKWTTKQLKAEFQAKFPDIKFPKQAVANCVEKLLTELKSKDEPKAAAEENKETQTTETETERNTAMEEVAAPPETAVKPETETEQAAESDTKEPAKPARKLMKLSKLNKQEDESERDAFQTLMSADQTSSGKEPVNYGLQKNKRKKDHGSDGKKKKKKQRRDDDDEGGGFLDLAAGADGDVSDDEMDDDKLTDADRAFVVDDDGLGYAEEDSPKSSQSKKGKKKKSKENGKGKKGKRSNDYDIEKEADQFTDSAFYTSLDLKRDRDNEERWQRIQQQQYKMELIREQEELKEKERLARLESGDIDPDETDVIYVGIAGSYCPELKSFNMAEMKHRVMEVITETWRLPFEKVVLVSGGMGGGDHVAIRLFIQEPPLFKGLTIRLPCALEPARGGTTLRGVDNKQPEKQNPGRQFNHSHAVFHAMVKEKKKNPMTEEKTKPKQLQINTFGGPRTVAFPPAFPKPPAHPKPQTTFASVMGQNRDVRDMFKSAPAQPPPKVESKERTTVEELRFAQTLPGASLLDEIPREHLFNDCHFAILIGLNEVDRKLLLANFKGKKISL